jgi:hypothetical protein
MRQHNGDNCGSSAAYNIRNCILCYGETEGSHYLLNARELVWLLLPDTET